MRLTGDSLTHFSKMFDLDFKTLTDYKFPKMPLNNTSVVISDVHAPFHLKQQIETIKDIEADNLIIAGDWFDFYSMSRFNHRSNPPISFEWEFRNAYEILVDICKCYPSVSLMITNHDNRVMKYLFDHVPKELAGFMRTNIIELLLQLIPNLKLCEQKTRRNFNYVYQYKDVVFTHIEKSAMQDSKILIDIYQHLYSFRKIYNLKEFNCIVQGHNHRASYINYNDTHCYLNPCLIDINAIAFDYVFNGKCQGRVPALGYMIMKFKNNKFDFENSKQIIL